MSIHVVVHGYGLDSLFQQSFYCFILVLFYIQNPGVFFPYKGGAQFLVRIQNCSMSSFISLDMTVDQIDVS